MKKALYYTILVFFIYFGGMLIYFGVQEVLSFNSYPKPLSSLDKDSIKPGDAVSGEIYCAVGELRSQYTEDVGGKITTRRVFIVPLDYEKDIKRQRYILYAAGDESEAQFLKSAIVEVPKEPQVGDRCIAFKGSAAEIDFSRHEEFAEFLIFHKQLVGLTEFDINFPGELKTSRMVNFIIYPDDRTSANPVFIIIGGAVCALGIAGIVLGAAVSARRKRLY